MRVPRSWLLEYVTIPDVSTREIAARLIRAGLEVETVDEVGAAAQGPIVVGRVLEFAAEPQSNGKTIRWCRVDVGPAHNDAAGGRGVVCGALNFAVGDLVVVCLPGSTLPTGMSIAARKTYGHVSDGMICSTRELGLGDEHSGILVLPPETADIGTNAIELLGLREDVIDIAVTADRGYALSIRGIAREVATAFGVPFRDPAAIEIAAASAADWPVRVIDASACNRFVTRSVSGFDPNAASPRWLARRLTLCGIRSISLAVDITNYVMLELGQPLHAYDRNLVMGPIVVRPAVAGESVRTLDGANRPAIAGDLLITDDSGPIGLAGVMGGSSTEIGATSTEILIEAAHFDPILIARAARKHKFTSEASRRFERGVDPLLAEYAAERAVMLLAELGGAKVLPGRTVEGSVRLGEAIALDLTLPERLIGMPITAMQVTDAMTRIGATHVRESGDRILVTPPSWRPDLQLPADLVEEIARLVGYDLIPAQLPKAPGGHGLTPFQRLRSRVGRDLAGAGYVEVLNYPFVSEQVQDALGLSGEMRSVLRLANPLSEEEPNLRGSLLPGLLAALRRNVGRGTTDLAIFEIGAVYRAASGGPAVRPDVAARPTAEQIAAVQAAVPSQPLHVGGALAGDRELAGWWGPGRVVEWADALTGAQVVARAASISLTIRTGAPEPWHPGRGATLFVGDAPVGHAGQLHPRVIDALGLPTGTCAFEVDLDALWASATGVVAAPAVSSFPVAKEDLALVVPQELPAATLAAALAAGAGHLLESVRLFDVYSGDQIPSGHKSLAFALRFRASDHTLEPAEVSAARDAAVAAAAELGARLR